MPQKGVKSERQTVEEAMWFSTFANALRQRILPDKPFQSEAEWKLHRVFADMFDIFIRTKIRLMIFRLAGGSSYEASKDICNHLLDFISQCYTENGQVARSTKVTPRGEDVSFHWKDEQKYYIYHSDAFFTHHFFRLDNGTSVNFVMKPTKGGIGDKDTEKKKRVALFDTLFAPPDIGDPLVDCPGCSVESWDDDLFVYFQRRLPSEGLSSTRQSELNDEAESYVCRQMTGSWERYAQLFDKRKGEKKTIFRTQLDKFTKKPRTGDQCDKFIHKNLSQHLNAELDCYIKDKMIDVTKLLQSFCDKEKGNR